MDRRNISIVVFIGLKMVSDTVDHVILLEELTRYGIRSKEYECFKSYLSNRTQACYVNECVI